MLFHLKKDYNKSGLKLSSRLYKNFLKRLHFRQASIAYVSGSFLCSLKEVWSWMMCKASWKCFWVLFYFKMSSQSGWLLWYVALAWCIFKGMIQVQHRSIFVDRQVLPNVATCWNVGATRWILSYDWLKPFIIITCWTE